MRRTTVRRLIAACAAAVLGACVLAAEGVPMSQAPTHLLVVDKSAGELVGVDLASGEVVWRVAVGAGPHETVAVPADVSPTGGPAALVSMYSTRDRRGQELVVVDLETREVSQRISTSPQTMPHGMALVPGTSRVVVTVERDDAVLSLDLKRPEEKTVIPIGERLPHMVVVTPDGQAAFVANIVGGSVARIDLASRAVTTAAVGAAAEGLAVTRDGSEVWVGSNEEHEVHVLSTTDLAERDVFPTCRVPIRVTPVGTSLMAVTCLEDSVVTLYDVASHEAVLTVSLPPGSAPVGTLPMPGGSRIFVAATATGTIYEVEVATGEVLRSFDVGREPDGMALVNLGGSGAEAKP